MIESLCSRFLWNGNITARAAAKVSWSQISLPRDEGGLGFRNLCIWNKTLCLKLIWLLFCESESLWALWVKENYIKEASFWSLDENTIASWTWKALLKLRPLAESFIRCSLGNGCKASFWFDSWCDLGPLIKHFGPSGPMQTGVQLTSAVAGACSNNGWLLRSARSLEAEEFQIMLCSVPLPSYSQSPDIYSWKVDDMDLESFSAKHTWEALRPRGQKQSWANKVWFKGHIPSHAFMMWVAQLDRLPTRSRLASWGLQIDTCCCVCNHYHETRDHIFLRCKYAEQIWKLALRRLGYRPVLFHTWEALLAWIEIRVSHCPPTLRKLTVQAVIYRLWRERNQRLHNGAPSPPQAAFKEIDRQIRNAILARKHRRNFKNIMRIWLRHE